MPLFHGADIQRRRAVANLRKGQCKISRQGLRAPIQYRELLNCHAFIGLTTEASSRNGVEAGTVRETTVKKSDLHQPYVVLRKNVAGHTLPSVSRSPIT